MKLEPVNLKISGGEPAGLLFKLHLVQLIIKSPHFKQFLVCSQFLDLALVEYHDQVGLPDGGKAVGDYD